jgi:hypothetical protein
MMLSYGLTAKLQPNMKQPYPKFSKDVGPRPDLNIEFGATNIKHIFFAERDDAG